MKKILFIALVLIIASCNQGKENKEEKENKTTEEIAANPNLKLQVYYFHSTRRCPTCNSIEDNMIKLLDKEYATEMEEGIIAFKSINIDDEESQAIVEKHEIYGSSLLLIGINNGKEEVQNFTEFAFANSKNNATYFYDEMNKNITEIINKN
jgi:hypothetical protein